MKAWLPWTAVARRWLEVLCYGLVGAVAFYVAAPLGNETLVRFPPLPGGYRPWDVSPWLIRVVAGGGVAALGYILATPLGLTRASLRGVHLHPPTGVAVGVALILVSALGTWPGSTGPAARLGTPTALAALSLFLLGIALARKPARRVERDVPDRRRAAPSQALTWPVLAQWASREYPVGDQDFFDRGPVVRRMVERLAGTGRGGCHIALLGTYGVGKTVLMQLVEDEFSQKPPEVRPLFCWVSCWGLERGTNPASHILNELVGAISRDIGGPDLSRLPDHYRHLLSSANTWLGTALDWIDPAGDLEGLIGSLDKPLVDRGKGVVVVLEDIDRDGDAIDAAQLQRLLWLLKKASRVSVVVAFDPQRLQAFDFAKVCDQIELLGPLGADDVRKVLNVLRRHCVEDFTFIDPDADGSRQDRLDITASEGELHVFARRITGHGLANHIAAVLKTPRNLRAVTDRVAGAWERLAGEIDWADLVILKVLRIGSPKTYEFLVANRYRIRHREDRRFLPEASERVKEAFDQHLKQVESPDGVAALVDSLCFEALEPGTKRPPLQGVGRLEPVDYFSRAVTLEVDGAVRDQRVLADLLAWRQLGNEVPVLTGLLAADDVEYGRLFEHFVGEVELPELQALTEHAVDEALRRDGVTATAERGGFFALWRTCQVRLPRSQETAAWISALVSRAAATSLPFANELYYFCASVRYGPLDAQGRSDVRRALVETIRDACRTSHGLLAILDKTRPQALRLLVSPDDRDEPRSVDREPQSWSWLGDHLMAVLEEDRGALREPIRTLIWLQDRKVIDKPSVEAIFSADVDALLRWLSSGPSNDEWREVAQAAADWVTERVSASRITSMAEDPPVPRGRPMGELTDDAE